jgi:hypothetical protein
MARAQAITCSGPAAASGLPMTPLMDDTGTASARRPNTRRMAAVSVRSMTGWLGPCAQM